MLQTTTTPSSCTIASEWKRYFQGTDQQDDDEENETVEEVFSSTLEHTSEGICQDHAPISSPFARHELKDFGRDYYRNLIFTKTLQGQVHETETTGSSSSQSNHSLTSLRHTGAATTTFSGGGVTNASTFSSSPQSYETEPNLGIPVGGEFMYLAQ